MNWETRQRRCVGNFTREKRNSIVPGGVFYISQNNQVELHYRGRRKDKSYHRDFNQEERYVKRSPLSFLQINSTEKGPNETLEMRTGKERLLEKTNGRISLQEFPSLAVSLLGSRAKR